MTDLTPLHDYLANTLNKTIKELEIQVIFTELRFVIPLRHLTETPIYQLVQSFDLEEEEFNQIAFFTDSSLSALREFVAFEKEFTPEQRSRLTFTVMLSEPSFQQESLLKDSKVTYKLVKIQLPFFIEDFSLTLAELPEEAAESAHGGDSGANFEILEALKEIEKNFGIFSEIFFKGINSQKIAARLYEETYCEVRIEQKQYPEDSIFDKLILLDRSADVLSCILTPVTYQAMLKEQFQTSFDAVYLNSKKEPIPKVEQSIWNPEGAKLPDCTNFKNLKQYNIEEFTLDSKTDPVYDKIRYLPLDKLSDALTQISNSIKSFYETANQSLAGLPLQEVKEHANKIEFYRLLEDKLTEHLKIANFLLKECDTEFFEKFDIEEALLTQEEEVNHEYIQDYIITLVLLNKPLKTILRLLCIYSLLNGGVDEKFFKSVIQQILHVYGYEYYTTFTYLVNEYWFTTTKEKAFSYKSASHFFGSNCMVKHAVFNSQAPLSIRLLELILYQHLYEELARCTSEDRNLQKYCSQMLCSTSPYVSLQRAVRLLPAGPSQTILMSHLKSPAKPKTPLPVLFVIVGGVSEAEITALQILQLEKGESVKRFGDCFSVTLLSNCTLTGDELLAGFIDEEVTDAAYGKEIGTEATSVEVTENHERRKRSRK